MAVLVRVNADDGAPRPVRILDSYVWASDRWLSGTRGHQRRTSSPGPESR